MRRRRTLIIAFMLAASMALGIGYAAFSETLTVSGSAKVNVTECLVKFSDAQFNAPAGVTTDPAISGLDTRTLTVHATGFSAIGQIATVHITVSNPHDFDVTLDTLELDSAGTKNSEGQQCFTIETTFDDTDPIPLAAGGTYEFDLTIRCTATDATTITDTFTLTFVAHAGT